MKDERIVQTDNKIWGEIGKLAYLLAAVAFFVKIAFLGMKLNDCVVEYTIMIGVPVYQLIRRWQLKLVVYKPVNKKKYWITEVGTILCTVVIYVFFFLGGSKRDLREDVIFLLAFVASLYLVRRFIYCMDRRQAEKLDKECEDPDDLE